MESMWQYRSIKVLSTWAKERSQEKGNKTLLWVEWGLYPMFILNPWIPWKWKIKFSILQDRVPTLAFKFRPIPGMVRGTDFSHPFGFWSETGLELHKPWSCIFRKKKTWNQNTLFPQIHWSSCSSMGGFGDWSFGRRETKCTKPKGGLLLLICFLMERGKCQTVDGRLRLLRLGLKD